MQNSTVTAAEAGTWEWRQESCHLWLEITQPRSEESCWPQHCPSVAPSLQAHTRALAARLTSDDLWQ